MSNFSDQFYSAQSIKDNFPIRSYMRRQGRMLASQKRALKELWPHFGIGKESNIISEIFSRPAPIHLEIGFGMGDALLQMASDYPENNYLGIEVYQPGVGQLLLGIEKMNLANIRIISRDAIEVLDLLPSQSLAWVYLFFPDPWSKKRHHKRRLVQNPFVHKLNRVLESNGMFHTATDNDDYARQILKVMDNNENFINRSGLGKFHARPEDRPLTKFERRGIRRGNNIRDLQYKKI
jgi:tRNA (guanine-N7-)-methyltransferase